MTRSFFQPAPEALRAVLGHPRVAVLPSGTSALAGAVHAIADWGAPVEVPAIGCWTVSSALWEAHAVPRYVDVTDGLRGAYGASGPRVVITPWTAAVSAETVTDVSVLDASVSIAENQAGGAATALSLGPAKPASLPGGGGLLGATDPAVIERIEEAAAHHVRAHRWLDIGPRLVAGTVELAEAEQRVRAILARKDELTAAAAAATRILTTRAPLLSPAVPVPGGVSSLVPVLLAPDYPVAARDVARVAAAHNLPLVTQPVLPPYREPGFTRRRPAHQVAGCATAEAIARRLLFVPSDPDVVACYAPAIARVLVVVAEQPAQFQPPYGLTPGGPPGLPGPPAPPGYLARRLDGRFIVVDESHRRFFEVPRSVAARILQESA